MSYDDRIEDLISNLLYEVNSNNIGLSEYQNKYRKARLLMKSQTERYWEFLKDDFRTVDSAINYSVVDSYLRFGLDDCDGGDIAKLAELLKYDEQLYEYCDLHTANEGIAGILKYGIAPKKQDAIAKAIALSNN